MKIPTYSDRTEAVEDNVQNVRSVCKGFYDQVFNRPICSFLLSTSTIAYRCLGGLYYKELKEWARIVGMRKGELLGVNLSYEFAQMGAILPFGCSSATILSPEDEFVHIRNMDWDAKDMGRTTVIIDDGRYMSVTNPGMLGALSGMVYGEFAITLNWVPPYKRPKWDVGPLFLVQYILENANTYEEAVSYAQETDISSPALFTIVGIEEACVVERSQAAYATRIIDPGTPLVTTNHYITNAMKAFNNYRDPDTFEESQDRYAAVLEAAQYADPDDYIDVVSSDEIRCDDTIQQMVLQPSTGEYEVVAHNNNHLFD